MAVPQRKIGVMLPEYRGVDTERKRNVPSLTFSVTEGAEWDWEGHWHSFKLCLRLGDLTAVVFWEPSAQLGPQQN